MLYKTIRTYGGGYWIRLFGHGLLVVLTERINDFRGSSPSTRQLLLCMGVKLSLTLREENRPRMFENRMLRRKFVSKREEVAGGWRRLHNEELHNLCASTDIIRMNKSRKMRWTRHVACMRNMRNALKMLLGKSEGKGPLERLRHR
jgi:hypothetical protein